MKILAFMFTTFVLALLSPAAKAQDKPIVGIYQLDDYTNTGHAEAFSAMIETAISASGKFRVMERSRLNKLVAEQGKAKGGVVTTNSPGKVGGFEGVDFLVYGSITGLSMQQKADIGTALIGGMLGGNSSSNNCKTGEVTLSADIKITDARTGEVRYVTRINEKQKAGTSCGNEDAQIDATGLLRSAADNVATGLVTAIYPIQVAAVQPDGVIVLNYGEGALKVGAYLTIFQSGDKILDPATGDVIGSNEFELGVVQITDVLARLSKAAPVGTFSVTPTVGAIARAASPEEIKRAKKAPKRR